MTIVIVENCNDLQLVKRNKDSKKQVYTFLEGFGPVILIVSWDRYHKIQMDALNEYKWTTILCKRDR